MRKPFKLYRVLKLPYFCDFAGSGATHWKKCEYMLYFLHVVCLTQSGKLDKTMRNEADEAELAMSNKAEL